MMNFLLGLLQYYDVDMMDSLSYGTHSSNNSVDSFIGRASLDSDNGSNTENSGGNSGSGDSSKSDKETRENDMEKPVGIIPPVGGKGNSDNGGSNGGISETDSGAPRTGISYLIRSLLKGYLSKITEVFPNIIPTQFFDYMAITTDYINGILASIHAFAGSILPILGSITPCLINQLYVYFFSLASVYVFERLVTFITACYRYVKFKDIVKLDLWVQVPTHLVDRLELLLKNPDLRNRNWIVTPIAGSWMTKENQYFSLTKLLRIKESLGIQHIGKMVIDCNTINLCFLERGLKSMNDRFGKNAFLSSIVQVVTKTFDHSTKKYVWGMFNTLVMTGVGVVVWYKFFPGTSFPSELPEGFMPAPPYETFRNPKAVLPGYQRVNYILTKDIVETAISIYQKEIPFTDILPPSEYNIENNAVAAHNYACVGTAIMIACFIATNTFIPSEPITSALME